MVVTGLVEPYEKPDVHHNFRVSVQRGVEEPAELGHGLCGTGNRAIDHVERAGDEQEDAANTWMTGGDDRRHTRVEQESDHGRHVCRHAQSSKPLPDMEHVVTDPLAYPLRNHRVSPSRPSFRVTARTSARPLNPTSVHCMALRPLPGGYRDRCRQAAVRADSVARS